MKKLLLAAVLVGGAVPASAISVQTSEFIFGGGTNFTGFEGFGAMGGGTQAPSYSEDGIDVVYVGDTVGIWTESQTTPDGMYSWYPNGGGNGYTRFTFEDANAFQILLSSGFYPGPTTALAWEVRLDGALVDTGLLIGYAPNYEEGWVFFGFSDGLFDEVRLQVRFDPGPFSPNASEAGAYDAVTLTRAIPDGVPEPASWAMMIAGFGLVGGVVRRRRPAAC